MIRSGTTCFSDMYFFPEVTATEVRRSGLRATLGQIVIDFPSAWARNSDEYLAKGMALHAEVADQPTIRTALAPHAPYTVSDAPLLELAKLSEQHDLPIHIHLHETAEEIAQSLDKTGERPLARLRRLGLLNARLVAVHMTQLQQEEIAELASHNAKVVHCPQSNLKLASGFAPLAALDRAGISCAIGTDGAASNNDLDMFSEMHSAALLAKAVANDAAAVPAARALSMATLGGARAYGWEDEIGSLLPGKQADIVAVDLRAPECSPLYSPLSQVVYAAGREHVSDSWVAGRRLLAAGKIQTLDEQALLAKAKLWQQRIASSEINK